MEITSQSVNTYGSRRIQQALHELSYPESWDKALKLLREANVLAPAQAILQVILQATLSERSSHHKHSVCEHFVGRDIYIDDLTSRPRRTAI